MNLLARKVIGETEAVSAPKQTVGGLPLVKDDTCPGCGRRLADKDVTTLPGGIRQHSCGTKFWQKNPSPSFLDAFHEDRLRRALDVVRLCEEKQSRRVYKTSDGYTFRQQADGTWGDGDMSWPTEVEMRRDLGQEGEDYTMRTEQQEAQQIPQVIESTKPVKIYLCPGCKQEIHEKHSYVDESGVDHHSDCGAAFRWPPPSPEEQAWLDNLSKSLKS